MVIVFLILLGVIVARLTHQEVDVGWGNKVFKVRSTRAAANEREAQKFRSGLEVYDDLSQAMVALIESTGEIDAGRIAKEWFNRFASSLGGHALHIGDQERYRVSVWSIDKHDGSQLKALGTFLAHTNRLPVAGTIAGWVYENRRPYYCEDTLTDSLYRTHDDRPRDYRSIYAVPLGPEEGVWGAITVDAMQPRAFDECDQHIIRSFAGLATAAGAAYQIERAEQIERRER